MRTIFTYSLAVIATLLLHISPAFATEIHNLAPRKAQEAIQSVEGLVILDIRTPDEFRSGHIPGARNIDFYGSNFTSRLQGLDKDTPYFVYCRTGRRSGVTLGYMKQIGFRSIYHLKDGINAWKAQGLPVTQ